MYQPWLDEGFAAPGARRTREDFEIAATCHLQITTSDEERRAVIDALKPSIALYMGGMGAKEQNFHKNVFDRMGYAAITEEVQELFLAGKREQAVALIPDDLVEDMHIVGDAGYVKERVAAWEETGVTTLLLSLPLGRRGPADRRDAGLMPETERPERNVLGEALEPCGTDPMTGFYRDGCCSTGPEDLGSHTICAVVSAEFLEHQRSIGNDLATPMPLYQLPGAEPR